MNRRDPLVRAAARIIAAFERGGGSTDPRLLGAPSQRVSDLLEAARLAERLDRLRRRALDRGWTLAAALVWSDVLREVRSAQRLAGEVLARAAGEPMLAELPWAAAPAPPSLRSLVEELRQSQEEFDDVAFDLKAGRVVATTKPIELEDVPLGRFAIELHLTRLRDRRDSSCFDCVALTPNPASGNDSVTHPHVQDRQLCAGDASAPISAALQQGRICDAFCLVRSVLQTYNPASPYVALDSWDGVSCGDCGCSTSRENTSGCEHCDQDYCDECMSCCEACDASCCRGCLDRDRESDAHLCPSCRTTCEDCGRVVNSDDVDGSSGLCPQCLARLDEEDESEDGEGGNADEGIVGDGPNEGVDADRSAGASQSNNSLNGGPA
jgi:hypothetical protein